MYDAHQSAAYQGLCEIDSMAEKAAPKLGGIGSQQGQLHGVCEGQRPAGNAEKGHHPLPVGSVAVRAAVSPCYCHRGAYYKGCQGAHTPRGAAGIEASKAFPQNYLQQEVRKGQLGGGARCP